MKYVVMPGDGVAFGSTVRRWETRCVTCSWAHLYSYVWTGNQWKLLREPYVLSSAVVGFGLWFRPDASGMVSCYSGQIDTELSEATCSQNTAQRRLPAAQESVLGVVVDVLSDSFIVDIAGAHFAKLPARSTGGKLHYARPKFCIGSLVLAGIAQVTNPERIVITCIDNCEYWRGLGPLPAGYKYICSKKLSQTLSLPCAKHFLEELGKSLRYEIAVGCNRSLWATSSSAAEVFLVKSALGHCF